MGTIASQITSLTIVYSTVYSGADQSKHQSSASLAFVWGIHRGPVNSPHKWPVTRKMFPFDDVIMKASQWAGSAYVQCLHIVIWASGNKLQWNVNQHAQFFSRRRCIWTNRLQNISHFVWRVNALICRRLAHSQRWTEKAVTLTALWSQATFGRVTTTASNAVIDFKVVNVATFSIQWTILMVVNILKFISSF